MQQAYTINLNNPWTALDEALYSSEKYVAIAAGRRSGKTYNALMWGVDMLLTTDRKSMLWVDTKHVNIDKYVSRHLHDILGATFFKTCTWNMQKKIFTFPNGSYIDFGSAERAENLEGFEYDVVILNEAGIITKRPSLWQNTVMPMTKGPKNLTRLIGTPKGRNLFFELFTLGKSGHSNWKSFQFSAYDSPFWDKEELDEIRTKLPKTVFDQEYLAEFTEDGSAVFRWDWDAITWSGDLRPQPGRRYSLGVDLAKTVDFTVITPIDNETLQMGKPFRFNQVDYVFQMQKMLEISRMYNNADILLDSTAHSTLLDFAQKSSLNIEGFHFTASSRTDLLNNYALKGELKEIRIPDDLVFLTEHKSMQFELTPKGSVTMQVPDGTHDDTIMSAALAVWKATKGNVKWEIGVVSLAKGY